MRVRNHADTLLHDVGCDAGRPLRWQFLPLALSTAGILTLRRLFILDRGEVDRLRRTRL
jgi:hypothetical protein